MGEQAAIRILLADEQSLFAEAVRVALEGQADLIVVAEARDGLQAVAEAERAHPDIVLLDADLPNRDGIRTASMIRERVPGCRAILLAGEEDQAQLIEALEAGVSGYVTKHAPLADLIEATRAVHRGETLVPPRMLGSLLARLIQRRRDREDAHRRIAVLTRREREVLALLTEGRDNDAIAARLVISPQTARTHVQNVLGKLQVHSRLEAAAFVVRNGIIEDLVPSDGRG